MIVPNSVVLLAVGDRLRPKANERAAWKVVQHHCPDRTEAQCREIIRTWVKNGVLVHEEYEDPKTRKTLNGLRVNHTKGPD
jgi:hypothetical protein